LERYVIVALFSYLLGTFNFSYLIGRIFYKKDIRQYGSKNAGASNAILTFGLYIGVTAGIFDAIKSLLAIHIVQSLYGFDIVLFGVSAFFSFMGHLFPFYMGFRGGKGTATIVGSVAGINFYYGLMLVGLFFVYCFIFNYISIAGPMMSISVLVLTIILYGVTLATIFYFLVVPFSVVKHIPNFKKIADHTEFKFRDYFKSKKKKDGLDRDEGNA
jgi:glycerol-3-phosphate acyltransferase PlsY